MNFTDMTGIEKLKLHTTMLITDVPYRSRILANAEPSHRFHHREDLNALLMIDHILAQHDPDAQPFMLHSSTRFYVSLDVDADVLGHHVSLEQLATLVSAGVCMEYDKVAIYV